MEIELLEVTEEDVQWIKRWEGYSAKAYWDYQQWSIGYGTRSFEGEEITENEASRRFKEALEKYNEILFSKLSRYPSKGAKTALLSAVYNLGGSGISPVIRHYNEGNSEMAANLLRRYHYAGGKPLPALIARRNAEADRLMRGSPRVQYDRTYWLMPPDATEKEFIQMASEAFSTRSTIGFSADDAGIGDLDNRNIGRSF